MCKACQALFGDEDSTNYGHNQSAALDGRTLAGVIDEMFTLDAAGRPHSAALSSAHGVVEAVELECAPLAAPEH